MIIIVRDECDCMAKVMFVIKTEVTNETEIENIIREVKQIPDYTETDLFERLPDDCEVIDYIGETYF